MLISIGAHSIAVLRAAIERIPPTLLEKDLAARVRDKLNKLEMAGDLRLSRSEARYLHGLVTQADQGNLAVPDYVAQVRLKYGLEQYLGDPEQLPAIFMAKPLRLSVVTLLPHDEAGLVRFVSDEPDLTVNVLATMLAEFAKRYAPNLGYSLQNCGGQYSDQFYVGVAKEFDLDPLILELTAQLEPLGYRMNVAPYV